MSIRYMILGSLMERPLHGYLLKTEAFRRVFSEFGVNDNQIYPTLKKLEHDGLIRKKIERFGGRPDRHVYSITAQGKKEFLKWLESGEGEERSFRYEFFRSDVFFIRCNFIRHLDGPRAAEKIRTQMRTVSETISDLKAAHADMTRRGVDPLHVSILEYGIKTQETRLAWLEDFLKLVRKNTREAR